MQARQRQPRRSNRTALSSATTADSQARYRPRARSGSDRRSAARLSLVSSGASPAGRPNQTHDALTAYFVTSTGTDIGKTFVTAGLIRHLLGEGRPASALKPLVAGYDPSVVETSDPAVQLRAQGRPVSAGEIAAIAPVRFRA